MSLLLGLSKSPDAPIPPPRRRHKKRSPPIPQRNTEFYLKRIHKRKLPPRRKTPPKFKLPGQVTAEEAERRLKELMRENEIKKRRKQNNPPGNPQTIAMLPRGPAPDIPEQPLYIPSSIGSFDLKLRNPYLADSLRSIRNTRGVNVGLASPLRFESPMPPSKTPPPPNHPPPEHLKNTQSFEQFFGGKRKTRRNSKRKKRKTRKRINKRKSRRRKVRKNKRKSRRRRR